MIGNTAPVDEQKVAELEALLRTSSTTLDDPLALHDQLYALLMSVPSRALPVLERATRALAADTRYTNDPRHLKLWLAYAKHCRDPEEVFLFLQERGIGRGLAALYEEWARWVMRRNTGKGGSKEAEKVLRMGVERGAQPLERLKRTCEELLKGGGGNAEGRVSGSLLEMTNSWTINSSSSAKREVGQYSRQFIDNGLLSFEEARAKLYHSRQTLTSQNSRQQQRKQHTHQEQSGTDDDIDDLAQAVNPDDLTHISVYRDNTADVKEMTKMLKANGHVVGDQAAVSAEGPNRSLAICFESLGSYERIKEPFRRPSLGNSSGATTLSPLVLGTKRFFVERSLGSRTFVAVDLGSSADSSNSRVVLKRVELCELAVISMIPSSMLLLPTTLHSFIFADCAVLVQRFEELGNAKRMLEVFDQKHQPIDNRIVLWLTRCMLSLLQRLLESGWICGTLSLETFVLKSTDTPLTEPCFKPDGSGGWAERGLVISGLPRAVPSGPRHVVSPPADPALPAGPVELDWTAVVGCIKQLLHIEQDDLLPVQWRQLFNAMKAAKQPQSLHSCLSSCLAQIDSVLVSSASSSTPSLKALVVRLEMALMSSD